MKRFAKIICTIGPSCRSRRKLGELVEAGMDAARFNFSHGTREEHEAVIEMLRRIAPTCTIIQDLAGPKIRIGELAHGKVKLLEGQEFTLTTRRISGDNRRVSVNYKRLPSEVRRGEEIFLSDGAIRLLVESVTRTDIRCRVLDGGFLTSRKGLNIPGGKISADALTEKDIQDMHFGLALGVDCIAISFVRSRRDMERARKIVESSGSKAMLIAKIERREALDNLESIVESSDAVMIARGDLGVEIPVEEVPVRQKTIITLARAKAKPVIVATQMLESMVASERPTRAEASDVANAVFDGADAMMLSAETATGRFPIESVVTMARIIERAEEYLREASLEAPEVSAGKSEDLSEKTSLAAIEMARHAGADAIVCMTHSGRTARLVSRRRYPARIIALTDNDRVIRKAGLIWGMDALKLEHLERTDELFPAVKRMLASAGIKGKVVLLAGIPLENKAPVNTVHFLSL